jgi:hypothetical protein
MPDEQTSNPWANVPEEISDIADLRLRQRATEAWRAACRLSSVINQWRIWVNKSRQGPVDYGWAFMLDTIGRECVTILCELGVRLPFLTDRDASQVLERFPEPRRGPIDPELDKQNIEEIAERVKGVVALDEELDTFMRLLVAAPSTAFSFADRVNRPLVQALVERLRVIGELELPPSSPETEQPPSAVLAVPGGQPKDVKTAHRPKRSRRHEDVEGRSVVRFADWALGLSENQKWVLFKRFGEEWRDQSRLSISKGRQEKLLKGFLGGKGYLSRQAIIQIEEVREQSAAAVRAALNRVRPELSNLRTR